MNTDVEDLLREGMERFTRDLRAPEGLTLGQRRRRRLAARSAAGAAAALTAGAVALTAVVVAGPKPDRASRSVVLAAYVVKRVDRALSAAEPGEIAQITVTRTTKITGRTVTTTAEEWSYGDQWRSVINSATGAPVYDDGFSSAGVYTLVSYPTRTWASEPGLGRPAARAFGAPLTPALGLSPALLYGARSGPAFGLGPAAFLGVGACKPVVAGVPALFQPGLPDIGFAAPPGLGFAASALPTARALRAAISCGALTEAGRQLVDGINAIKLTSRRSSPISETIWVSPGTYLPVRMVVSSALGFGGVRQTADITWLPPTAQNLATLTVSIPAGFRRVSIPQAVMQILVHLRRRAS